MDSGKTRIGAGMDQGNTCPPERVKHGMDPTGNELGGGEHGWGKTRNGVGWERTTGKSRNGAGMGRGKNLPHGWGKTWNGSNPEGTG